MSNSRLANELKFPNIYKNIPSTQRRGLSENDLNFNKILIDVPKDDMPTEINYDGLRKHYLKTKCKKLKF